LTRLAVLREVLKHLLETALVRSQVPRALRPLVAGHGLVLAYHNIVPDGGRIAGDTSLHLPQQLFAWQLDYLVELCRVVPLDQLLAAPDPRASRPQVAVTFDDAYRGAVTAGLEELASRGLPATIFVAPAFVGGRTFWWDRLSESGAAGPAPAVRRHALDACRGVDAEVATWAAGAGVTSQAVEPHMRVASEEELGAAVRQGGITLGSHSWSHPNLTRLGSPQDLEHELTAPLSWLRDRYEAVRPWLAIPYGISSPEVERAAGRAGYSAAFRVSGGWLPAARSDLLALPRLNVPSGLSRNGFALRCAGLLS
jgi:peptidoglycan/xylan/chitin deacetylase (PgdA/CDA1 family)